MELFRNRTWDIIGKSKLWFTLSITLTVIGMVAWGIWGLNFGIDFTGGSMYRYQFASPLADSDAGASDIVGKVRGVLGGLNLGSSNIQLVADDDGQLTNLYLRTPPVANDEEAARRDTQLQEALRKVLPDKGEITDLGRESVGPVVGAELRTKALWAFFLGTILIMLYITVRYEFRFAVAAIVALLHDILIVMGCMAVFRVELNSAFVAAILSVLGYSINDTVVIFDRIRENMRLHRRASFAETANASLLETMARSVNTVMTLFICVVALLVFGGEAIRGFSLAMLFGVVIGCYSSVFIASPIVVWWDRRAATAPGAAAAAGRARATARRAPAQEAAGNANGASASPASLSGVEKVQREAIAERTQAASAELEQKREERRERRKREKDRAVKKTGKPKRRF